MTTMSSQTLFKYIIHADSDELEHEQDTYDLSIAQTKLNYLYPELSQLPM